jgi:mRNA interferase MazF
MGIFERWSIVVVPFPFTDQETSKRRPALVLSQVEFARASGHSILAMITSGGRSRWPSDVAVQQHEEAGLRAPSLVRFKLFTLEQRLILRRVGFLQPDDRSRVELALRQALHLI